MDLSSAVCTVVGHDRNKVWERCRRCGHEKDTSVIPKGYYCYKPALRRLNPFSLCPYWSKRSDKPDQENGYCSYLEMGDWEEGGTQLLWDQVKECGILDNGT